MKVEMLATMAASALALVGAQAWTGVETEAPIPAAGSHFACTVTSVHDGDGPIRCEEGMKVRLHAIAAREIDESCNPGHPCPTATGASAKAALQRLTLNQVLQCQATGASYGRVTAWCTAGGEDLSCAMVRGGYALRWDKYDRARKLCAA